VTTSSLACMAGGSFPCLPDCRDRLPCRLPRPQSARLDHWTVNNRKILKISSNCISQSLSCIVNSSLETGVFPNRWKIAKANIATNRDDYRPISILPCLSKICESLFTVIRLFTVHWVGLVIESSIRLNLTAYNSKFITGWLSIAVIYPELNTLP
jgi:hypothetical protein